MVRSFAAAVVALSLATPAFADDAVSKAAYDLVSNCPTPPDATAILVALQRAHRIGISAGFKASGETCWRVRPALAINSLQFQYICAANHDLTELLPDLYYLTAGAQPGISVRLLTRSSLAEVQDWASGYDQKRIGPDRGYVPLPDRKLTQFKCSDDDP